MFNLIKELFSLLTQSQRKRFFSLQIMVVLMAIAEIVGVASIVPFMALVGDMTLLQQDTWIASIYQFSGIKSETNFVFVLGFSVLFSLVLSAIISMLTTWRLAMFASKVGAEIGDRLYVHYLDQNWLFHANGSSAQLTKRIANETTRLTGQVLLPLMQMNARLMLVLFIATALIVYDPMVAVVGLVFFTLSYFLLYKLVRKKLQNNGASISQVYEQRFRLMGEGFGGIKDLMLLGRTDHYKNAFKNTGLILAHGLGTNTALANVPRYFMELVAFGSMITLVLYLLAAHQGNLGMVLPLISVYALAAFKLLPAFQQIYNSTAQIKGNLAAFNSIKQDMLASQPLSHQNEPDKYSDDDLCTVDFENWRHIELKSINFNYAKNLHDVLSNINMSLPKNNVIGIVGPSGSGKSTLIDLVLKLIEPVSGVIQIDGIVVDALNKRKWQKNIGFVPQSIYLSEGSIAENVAFGIDKRSISIDKVNSALKLSHLDELVASLPKGMHTQVGERGVKLSGGQRQRLGIARALYSDPSILIFDEATSALDGITEKMVMEAIQDFAGKKTIILIAHRLSTVKKCDCIYLLDKGEIVASGTYDQLVEKNQQFKKMASFS